MLDKPFYFVILQEQQSHKHNLFNLCKTMNICPSFFRFQELRDKTMVHKLMYILNDDKQNYPFYILQLVVETFGYSI